MLGLIAFTPLAFGTVEAWSIAIMEWGIVTLLLLLALGHFLAPRATQPLRQGRTGLELPVALFLLFCALQTVPLPARWLRTIAPGSAKLYEGVDFRAWAEARHPGITEGRPDDRLLKADPPQARPVSVRPAETWGRIRLVAAFSGVVFLVVWWADRRRRIVFLLTSVTVVGFIVALHGLVQFLTWNGKIYWFRRIPPASAFGPFVNHNHFAGYVEMVIPVAISLVFYLVELRRSPEMGRPNPEERWALDGVDRRIVERTSRLGKAALALFAAVLLVVSLFFCLSRGGILSAVISGLILFVLLWRRIASRALGWSIALGVPVLVIALIAWIGSGVVTQQIGSYQTLGGEASFRLRVMVWESLIRNLRPFLWVGSGLGTFEESFAQATPSGSSVRWDKAHNDYLQLLWETGVVGFVLFLAAVLIFTRRYWWRAVHSREHPLDLFRVAIAVSILSIALHSLLDFNLQIGANGFLFALLAGLMIALQREIEGGGEEGGSSAPIEIRR